MVVAGGITTDNAFTKSVEIFDPVTGTWSAGTDLPDNRWGGKAIVIENQLLLVAGRIDDDYAPDILAFNQGQWESLDDGSGKGVLQTPRHYTLVANVPITDCDSS